jgi:hypothetical protein
MKKSILALLLLPIISLAAPQGIKTPIPNGYLQQGALDFQNFKGINVSPGTNPNDIATFGQIPTIPAPPSGSNPSAQVGTSVINGSSLSFMRSDAAPAINQALTPIWTGQHIFKYDGIGTAQNDARGILIENTTSALASDQYSPEIRLRVNTYALNSNTSIPVDFRQYISTNSGSDFTGNGGGSWVIESSINGASYVRRMAIFSGGGVSIDTSDLGNEGGPGFGVLNVGSGFQINGSATLHHYLRGNSGTYVDSAILLSDLPTITGGSNTQLQYNNNGLFGGVSGTTYDGSGMTFDLPVVNSYNGSSGVAVVRVSGIPFSGTGSTSWPALYINSSNASPTSTLNTSGTSFGINAHAGIGNLVDLMVDGVSKLSISPTGSITTPSITGSAASLSISGQTGLLSFTGLLSNNKVKTVSNASDTILELSASYAPTGMWTSMPLTTPKITTGINDANGNSMLAFTATASAVDGFTFTNAATANPATVTMAATGSDSNIKLALNAKGTSPVTITSGNTGASDALTITSTGATGPRISLVGTDRSVSWGPGNGSEINVIGSFRTNASNSYLQLDNSNSTTVYGRLQADGTSTAGVLQLNNGTQGQWIPLKLGVRDSVTTTVTNGLTIGHQSTGTPAAGLGSGILFNIDSSTTADQNAARIAALWTDATHATRTADMVGYTVNSAAALTETWRSKANGDYTVTGNLIAATAGKGLQVKGGSNAKIGTGTLTAGTATISTTAVTANSRIFVTDTNTGSLVNVGSLVVSAKNAGTSFVVTSTNALDVSTFDWMIVEQN